MRRANPAGVSSRSARLGAALLAAAAGAQAAHVPPRARLVAVRVGGDAEAARVEIASDRPVSFTTLRLQAPPRVVVDFADAELSGVPAEQEVEDGTIRRVGAAAAGARTARVIVELAFDAEFDVQARADVVEVRVARRPPPPPALAAAPSESPREAAPATAAAAPDAAPIAAAEPAAAPDLAEARRDEQARAALPTVALAGPGSAKELSGVPDPTPAPPPAPPPAPAAERTAATPPPPPAAPTAERAADPASARPRAAGRAHIRAIGFRPQGAGAVVVRADGPLEVGVERSESALLLHFASASIPLANSRRPLETAVFGGPVQRIVPLPGRGGTDVRIELSENAAYALQQDGGVVTVTFNR